MAVYTSVLDVEAEWNQTVPAGSEGHVVWLINKAERIIRNAVPDLQRRLTDELIEPHDIAIVAATMVVRLLNNPRGFQGETAGDYSYQLGPAAAAGRMYLSADERSLLGGRRYAGSMPLDDTALQRPLKLPTFSDDRSHAMGWEQRMRGQQWTVPATGEAP